MKTLRVQALLFLALILASRMALLALGMAPDPNHLEGNWQTLALDDLARDLAHQVWNLHSQPPLWNTLVGLGAKLCNAELNCVVWLGYAFNVAGTWLAACMLLTILQKLHLNPKLAFTGVLIFIFSPSTLYYEAYIFYTHVSLVLMLGIVLCLLRLGASEDIKPFGLALISSLCLCWLWSLFHPMFIAIIFVAGLIVRPALVWSKRGAILFVCVMALAAAPSVKNQIKFGLFSNGSWVGLNMSQVIAEVRPGFEPSCNFFDFMEHQKALNGTTHPGTALNAPDMVSLSNRCVGAAVRALFEQPGAVALNRLAALIERHKMMPHDYFLSPINWDVIPDLPFGRNGSFNNTMTGVSVTTFEWITLAFYTFAWLMLVNFALRHPTSEVRRFFQVVLLIAIWFTVLSFAFNRGEQQRMRYTIEPFFLISLSVVVTQWLELLRFRRQ